MAFDRTTIPANRPAFFRDNANSGSVQFYFKSSDGNTVIDRAATARDIADYKELYDAFVSSEQAQAAAVATADQAAETTALQTDGGNDFLASPA